jgi:bacteriorhodopsin
VDPTVTLWNWVGATGMAVGVVVFGLATRRATNAYAKQSRVTLFFVPVIAAALYTAMGMGQGSTVVEGEKVYWVRYVTWFTTTPLLLLQLCRLVHARQSVVLGLVLGNQFMIATGLAAELSGTPRNWVWYAISSVAFVFLCSPSWATSRARATACPPTCGRSSAGCATSTWPRGSATRSCGRWAPRGLR